MKLVLHHFTSMFMDELTHFKKNFHLVWDLEFSLAWTWIYKGCEFKYGIQCKTTFKGGRCL